MFQLITSTHKKQITRLAQQFSMVDISAVVSDLTKLIEKIRSDIPERKRISFGRYSIIKKMGFELYPLILETGFAIFDFSLAVFNNPNYDQFVRSLAIQLVSIYGTETKDLKKVLPFFEKASTDEHWEVRECSAGFIGKLTKKYPIEMHKWYLTMVNSENPLQRRFASESLRPVSDNRWLYKQPEFAFSVIKYLFKEPVAYPRASVGNNLSDWMRIDEKLTYKIVEELAKNGDKNSYWIAYRACRNLVKKEPIMVMDMLGVDTYKYKDRIYSRNNKNTIG